MTPMETVTLKPGQYVWSDALMAEAKKDDWIVISMKDGWKPIFPFGSK
jgi:hypothetical protein